MFHSDIMNAAVKLAGCANAVTDTFETIFSALYQATTLLNGDAQSSLPTLPSWLCGAAIWIRLRKSQFTADTSHMRLDSETSVSLLHCLTLDIAGGMLRGDDSRQVVEDVAVAVWKYHVDALHCLSDSDHEHLPVAAIFRHCVPDVVQRLQPLACLRLFVQATHSGLRQFPAQWDVNRTLQWYICCVQLFDSGSCAISTIMTTLQQASEAICHFASTTSMSQLQNIDQATLDAVDPHIRIAFRQFCEV